MPVRHSRASRFVTAERCGMKSERRSRASAAKHASSASSECFASCVSLLSNFSTTSSWCSTSIASECARGEASAEKAEKSAPQQSSAHCASASWKKHELPCSGAARSSPAALWTSTSTSATLRAKFLNANARCLGGLRPSAARASSSSDDDDASPSKSPSSPPPRFRASLAKFPNFAATNLASSLRACFLLVFRSGSANPLRRLFVTCFAALPFFAPPPDFGGIADADADAAETRARASGDASDAASAPRDRPVRAARSARRPSALARSSIGAAARLSNNESGVGAGAGAAPAA
ncbi:uncharacterized protein MICPUCDRAFT_65508 [Micromonas pusilla CCMP1545]|uniref:Predicted protein n=1 Tax=Micromonas pusilla (strain CCMP1545) TaxID=564608 RepID=C1MVY9_MICPC|nr:uncharacterized protein MICPUCDRAFT_65508 [Micromonas pusilla CCMP1545]EEH55786.1 predicted protein [Micromonas pusilla CCMP1545]|eukprot:XP_003059834.1 predicted protein [Micromonas pusilla CCMP1545]